MVRGLEHLSYEPEKAGPVQPGEEKALGRPHSPFPYLRERTKKPERDSSPGAVVRGQGGMASH